MIAFILLYIAIFGICYKVDRVQRRAWPLAHKHFDNKLVLIEALVVWFSLLASAAFLFALIMDVGYPGLFVILGITVALHITQFVMSHVYERKGRALESAAARAGDDEDTVKGRD